MENSTIQINASDGTVGKALVMLDLVASFERPVRFSEILSKSAYPKSHRISVITNALKPINAGL